MSQQPIFIHLPSFYQIFSHWLEEKINPVICPSLPSLMSLLSENIIVQWQKTNLKQASVWTVCQTCPNDAMSQLTLVWKEKDAIQNLESDCKSHDYIGLINMPFTCHYFERGHQWMNILTGHQWMSLGDTSKCHSATPVSVLWGHKSMSFGDTGNVLWGHKWMFFGSTVPRTLCPTDRKGYGTKNSSQ